MSISPKDQHKIQAEKILARRANGKSNTTGKQTPDKNASNATKKAKTTVAPEKTTVAPVVTIDPYANKKRKDLRKMCDNAVPAIVYKNKDTIEMLIGKLKG